MVNIYKRKTINKVILERLIYNLNKNNIYKNNLPLILKYYREIKYYIFNII